MVWVPGATFLMGSDDFYPEERPVRPATVDGFWIDEHPVTVAGFRRFVKDTGHVTTAERAPDAADFPDADPELLVPGSLVFVAPPGPVPLDDFRQWWAWTPGTDWRHPDGPASGLDDAQRHPVTHVAYDERWPTPAGRKGPPTEASGSGRHGAGSTGPSSRGVTSSSRRADDGQHCGGRFHGRTRSTTGSAAPRR